VEAYTIIHHVSQKKLQYNEGGVGKSRRREHSTSKTYNTKGKNK
jgi:hypothetical protein